MSENQPESTDDGESTEEPEIKTRHVPAMQDFEVTATRKFEVSYSNEQLQNVIEEYGVEDEEEAIQLLLSEREVEFIEPTEKLLALEVDANGPSDN